MSIWIFSNNRAGHYEDSDWDTSNKAWQGNQEDGDKLGGLFKA